jgi:hypothetical protein
MFAKQRKDSTDPRLRSLLQKAVRRGHSDVVESTARHLDAARDKTWLRSRAVVITFEECWPMAQHLSISTHFDSRLAAFLRVASAEKQKDAAGLGALAYAFGEGDQTMLDVVPNRWALRTISEALRRPLPFFEWAQANCASPTALQIVDAARRYLAAATWGWDKACIIAGAFLAITVGVPESRIASDADGAFPYWVALDKHTPQGKAILHEVARERSVSYRHLIWSSFYFESAKVNAIVESPWWSAERAWRLTRAGLTTDAAEQLWEGLRAVIAEWLRPEAEELRRVVEAHGASQGSLF